jgi:hypothetical protein
VEEPWVNLAQAVKAIRSELQEALLEGEGEQIHFRAGPIELEFSIDVKKDASGGAKVFVVPWSAEARGSWSTDRVHRMTVTLQPVDAEGRDADISDRAARRPS